MPRHADRKSATRNSPDLRPRPPVMQQTLSKPAVVSGLGYWSGREVRVEFCPAPSDAGISFVRTDLAGTPRIPARIEHRIETPLRTTLTYGGARVEMIEHVLAAVAGLGIDNCEIRVNQVEMPGLDGSALPFVEALLAAGITALDTPAVELLVRESARLGDDQAWIEARPASGQGLSLRYRLDYRDLPSIGQQTIEFDITPEVFCRELAPCRTFIRKAEAEWLRQQGFAKNVTTADVLVFDEHGPIDNELRFEDECARHKMLDLVGDLSLLGYRIVGWINSHCGGHRLNGELVKILLQEGQKLHSRRRSA